MKSSTTPKSQAWFVACCMHAWCAGIFASARPTWHFLCLFFIYHACLCRWIWGACWNGGMELFMIVPILSLIAADLQNPISWLKEYSRYWCPLQSSTSVLQYIQTLTTWSYRFALCSHLWNVLWSGWIMECLPSICSVMCFLILLPKTPSSNSGPPSDQLPTLRPRSAKYAQQATRSSAGNLRSWAARQLTSENAVGPTTPASPLSTPGIAPKSVHLVLSWVAKIVTSVHHEQCSDFLDWWLPTVLLRTSFFFLNTKTNWRAPN